MGRAYGSQPSTLPAAPTFLSAWTAERKALQKSSIVPFEHRLRETGLFEDDALAAPIDAQRRNALDICTMQPTRNNVERKHARRIDVDLAVPDRLVRREGCGPRAERLWRAA